MNDGICNMNIVNGYQCNCLDGYSGHMYVQIYRGMRGGVVTLRSVRGAQVLAMLCYNSHMYL